ncbi:MoaD/ThiS family protein [Dyadobacter sp. Leaf189]|uniref:MoaD/ThiS family protein n=1 Tax=Dyadobacter sp. Leaf189 TaxID=1736295 RepID=UPI0006FCBF72|nr:MoaD/ThiS family protein [Dyadobacter sp. Leaf189]KQS24705.1 thiamine biosynthesis protein ThiS [Dyadobacter sp. Leaf189]
MSLHVLYFGMLAEVTGLAEENWLNNGQLTVGDFRAQVMQKYPALQGKKFKIAVNQRILEDLADIAPQSEVALLPPFAGG